MSLRDDDVETFVRDGFVRLPGAFPADVAARCADELWDRTGYDRDDPSTWTDTLVRVDGLGTPPFREAASTPVLHEAFDRLVGPGGWIPRTGLGTFPLRFPGPGKAKEAGWHIESSFSGPDGEWRVNLRSRGRALLMLFLFSEVGPDDAPTLVRVGSHLDVPRFLEPIGNGGIGWMDICTQVVPASARRPVAEVVGSPGDVYLCHPFLVHSAQAHRGRVPRFMAQPPLEPIGLLDLATDTPTPVARAVLDGLSADRRTEERADAVRDRRGGSAEHQLARTGEVPGPAGET